MKKYLYCKELSKLTVLSNCALVAPHLSATAMPCEIQTSLDEVILNTRGGKWAGLEAGQAQTGNFRVNRVRPD